MTITLFENTFITLQDANLYFQNRPDSDKWNELSDLKKEQALIFASIKINNFNFIGQKQSQSQPLEFPRNLLVDIPKEIQYAVCEEAISIIENSVHHKNKKYNISSTKIGSSSVSYKNDNNLGVLISQDALALVSKWTEKGFYIH